MRTPAPPPTIRYGGSFMITRPTGQQVTCTAYFNHWRVNVIGVPQDLAQRVISACIAEGRRKPLPREGTGTLTWDGEDIVLRGPRGGVRYRYGRERIPAEYWLDDAQTRVLGMRYPSAKAVAILRQQIDRVRARAVDTQQWALTTNAHDDYVPCAWPLESTSDVFVGWRVLLIADPNGRVSCWVGQPYSDGLTNPLQLQANILVREAEHLAWTRATTSLRHLGSRGPILSSLDRAPHDSGCISHARLVMFLAAMQGYHALAFGDPPSEKARALVELSVMPKIPKAHYLAHASSEALVAATALFDAKLATPAYDLLRAATGLAPGNVTPDVSGWTGWECCPRFTAASTLT